MGQGAAIIFATLFKCDIGQAQGAASNAIENNFIFALMPVITGAMKLYDILTTIDGAIDAYDEGGFAALAQYGLDEGSTRLLMGSSMKIVGNMISKARTVVRDMFKASSSGASSSASSAATSGAKAAKDVPVSEGKAAKDSFKTQAKNVETKETKPNGGRGKNYLKPDEKAEGDHTVFRSDKDGGVFKYETYKQNPKNPTGFDSSKRVDMTGDPHFNKKTGENVSVPHVQSKDIPGGVRPANPTEIPKSFAE